MPIFEYICRDCRHSFEVRQSGTARPRCPSCASGRLEKQLSVFATGGASSRESGAGFDAGGFDRGGAEGGYGSDADGDCGTCGDPRGPGSCAMDDD